MMTAKTVNAATGDDALWRYFAVVIPEPEPIGSLASLMRTPQMLGLSVLRTSRV